MKIHFVAVNCSENLSISFSKHAGMGPTFKLQPQTSGSLWILWVPLLENGPRVSNFGMFWRHMGV